MTPFAKGPDILWLARTESTNAYARSRIDGLDNMSVVSATEQCAGRGQADHVWHSAPGMNLTFTIVFKPVGLSAADGAFISFATALGVRDYLDSRGIHTRIKLPNDIWSGSRKICGILIENLLEGKSVIASIIGIGLNVNQTNWPDNLPNPVSMKELTGSTYDTAYELKAAIPFLVSRLTATQDARARENMKSEFDKASFSPENH